MMQAAIAPPRSGSVETTDPDIARRIKISVDGTEQSNVVAYDCDAGTVLRFKLDADGKIVLNEKRDEIVRETVRGIVTVEWKQ